jgi:hypothetical protein
MPTVISQILCETNLNPAHVGYQHRPVFCFSKLSWVVVDSEKVSLDQALMMAL